MSSSWSFIKTCLSEILVLVAIAVPVLGAGCERPAEPPIERRSALPQVGQSAAPAPADPGGSRVEDAAITARVKSALLADDQVKGLAIDVDTRNAEVTLKGSLEQDDQVRRAMEVARGVDGVRDVINRLSVKGEDKAAGSTQG
jgi:hyperosmotically inducible periplasmic protein